VAPAFAKERDTLWVMLVLGESIISLGMYGQTKDTDYYINLFLGFFLIYSILRLFLLSQVRPQCTCFAC
jgi:low temperature requirement protein LtrA